MRACTHTHTHTHKSSMHQLFLSLFSSPLPDYSFEALLSRNLSIHQLIFLHEAPSTTPQVLLQLNTTIYHTAIVPNDPADFGRNSFDMQTVNSIMSLLHHRHVDILKLESLQDMAHSYEVLYFMVKDGILSRFHQLHIMMEIGERLCGVSICIYFVHCHCACVCVCVGGWGVHELGEIVVGFVLLVLVLLLLLLVCVCVCLCDTVHADLFIHTVWLYFVCLNFQRTNFCFTLNNHQYF